MSGKLLSTGRLALDLLGVLTHKRDSHGRQPNLVECSREHTHAVRAQRSRRREEYELDPFRAELPANVCPVLLEGGVGWPLGAHNA